VREGAVVNLTLAPVDAYIQEHIGDEFTAKDFRTWGGTLTAAIAFAERCCIDSAAEQKRIVAAVMRRVAERLSNTSAVCRASYVSPAVVEQYLERSTIEDFRPAICASCPHPKSVSTWKSRHCSTCCARGEYAGRALPRRLRWDIRLRCARIGPLEGESIGSQNRARL